MPKAEALKAQKAGDRDRTGDIQLGNLSVPPKITAENTVLPNTPSSIPSGPGNDFENELAVIVAAWPQMPAAVRTALLATTIAVSQNR